MKTNKIFFDCFRKTFGKGPYPNFPPNNMIGLGDYGVIKDNNFIKLGNIVTSFGIKYETDKISQSGEREHFNENCQIEPSVKFDIDGKPLIIGFKLKFNNKKAVFYNSVLSSVCEIRDPKITLQNVILDLYKSGLWERNYVLIYRVGNSQNTIIAVSSNTGGEISFECKNTDNSILRNVEELFTANANMGFNISYGTENAYGYSNDSKEVVSKYYLMGLRNLPHVKLDILTSTYNEEQPIYENDNNKYDPDIVYELDGID